MIGRSNRPSVAQRLLLAEVRADVYQAEQACAPGTEGRFWIARLALVHFVEPVLAVRGDGGLGRDAELKGLKHVAT